MRCVTGLAHDLGSETIIEKHETCFLVCLSRSTEETFGGPSASAFFFVSFAESGGPD